MRGLKTRLAIVVSHPIQYYVPLYQRMAQREDVEIRVFYTWHAGGERVHDPGFGGPVEWDIPLLDGYPFGRVPNLAREPGTHHFLGLRCPGLVDQVMAWHPDAIHLTGWAWLSHLVALRAFRRRRVPTLFRGDSNLLNASERGPRALLKRYLLKRIFSWPTAFLVVGSANRAYYRRFGVEGDRLFACPHSVDVARFAEPSGPLEAQALEWRDALGIDRDASVLLFAGKFEARKRPLELMRAVKTAGVANTTLILVGSGALEPEVRAFAAAHPTKFRVIPFQNQSLMPVVYRLGDLFVLPSAESWGLAANEAMASGRPVLVTDRAGCAEDVVDAECGRTLPFGDSLALMKSVRELVADRKGLMEMRPAASRKAWLFDIGVTESTLIEVLRRVALR